MGAWGGGGGGGGLVVCVSKRGDQEVLSCHALSSSPELSMAPKLSVAAIMAKSL